jgi:molybdate transport system substrate-binding protein
VTRRVLHLLIAASAALVLAGCASGSGSNPSAPAHPPTAATTDALSGDLTIYAAASLKGAFDDLAAQFEKAHPAVTVQPIDYDGSSTLATQLIQGAPAAVFASADQVTMSKVVDAGLIGAAPVVFARNTLQIAVQPGNPHTITGLADLADPDLQVVLCAPQVPCGAASHALLDRDGVAVKPVSEEQNVTAVLTKVRTGNADAGLVYVTDVTAAAGSVDGVRISDANKAVNEYPIATMKDAPNPAAGAAFVKYVLSRAGQGILAKHGFAKP